MPMPAAATPLNTVGAMVALLLTITVPLMFMFAVPTLPPRYPADTPDGVELLLVKMPPKLMVPNELTVTRVADSGVVGFDWLTALIPELPELMMSRFDVVTARFPMPQLNAPMPYGELPPLADVAETSAVMVTL